MGYKSLHQCAADLKAHGKLIEIDGPIEANLEAAEIHRRVFERGGPAILFSNVVGCRYPMLSNLFGDIERARFLFRDTLDRVRSLIQLKIDPNQFWRRPARYLDAARLGLAMRPKRVSSGAVVSTQIKISDLPQLVSWPDDGGAFVTLPQVYSEDPDSPGLGRSNLGMYRIQLSGGDYRRDQEVGLHYQLHRGIGVHHESALRRGDPFRVNVFVGGTPSMSLAAVMPLPEGVSELGFAGALAGHRIRMLHGESPLPIYADADFCITGVVHPDRLLPEGPFGDHLGYYSLRHPFPVLEVEKVFARHEAIWPFTVVGRPPQEDTAFGAMIHELTGPIIPTVIPGVRAVHAVDAAGVHPLLLAIGSERYTPYLELTQPQELLTQANAILGQGQMSLAKYVWIANGSDDQDLDIRNERAFFHHMLSRVDWRRDLHFYTKTTIDTLDYSGDGLSRGSKVVIAAIGPARHELATELSGLSPLPDGFSEPHLALPGVVVVRAPACQTDDQQLRSICSSLEGDETWNRFRLIVLSDDPSFAARSLGNFVWSTFTRSNPASDIDGVGAFVDNKHWGCSGPLVIDARRKPRHAPPLLEDDEISRKVDAIAARGGPLATYL